MPFLIDGHNLIPAVGLRLDDADDEAKLIAMLRRYCAQTRKSATVYFDRKAPGVPEPAARGGLTIHFCSPPSTADGAIRRHLARLHSQASNWTVVSSDHQVQQQARLAGARVLNAPAFAANMRAPRAKHPEEKPDEPLTPDQAAELERMFTRPNRRHRTS